MGRIELTIAGVGGQGSIMAGVILGTAAVTHEGMFATQTQAYSSELRGGFAATWLVISDEPVVFPRVTHPDILVAQAEDSIARFGHLLKPGGILLFDSDMVRAPALEVSRRFHVPATSIARNEVKMPVAANIVMLGALCKATGVVGREALIRAVSDSVPKGKEELNLKAFDYGYAAVCPS